MALTPGPDMEQDPQLAAIYRAGAEAGPPPQLDDVIHAAARREVGAGPRCGGFRRWQLPLSLAAVLLLSVTVVTQMREQGADRPEALIAPPPLPPAAAPAEARRELAPPPRPLLRSAPAPLAADRATGAAAAMSAKSAVPPAPEALWQDLLREPAERWIQRIVELRRGGRTADADALTAEFRRRFPDTALPEAARAP
jgi:hypothetical protein